MLIGFKNLYFKSLVLVLLTKGALADNSFGEIPYQ